MITLIGMSGVGKSTVGKLLATELDFAFIDSDDLLVDTFDMSVSDLLKAGEDDFLKKELQVIMQHAWQEKTVLATGGSVVYIDSAMQHLRTLGTIFYLASSLDSIAARVHFATRGVVLHGHASVKEAFAERELLYRSWADITIMCEDKTIEEIVVECIKQYSVSVQ